MGKSRGVSGLAQPRLHHAIRLISGDHAVLLHDGLLNAYDWSPILIHLLDLIDSTK